MNRSFLCSILYFVDRGKAEADALILNGGFLMDYNNYDRGYAEPSMSASDYMTRTYRWMAGGLLVTFAMAYITATTPLIYLVDSLYFLLTIGELALVFMLSARVQKMSIDGARAAFFGYAILNGMVLSYYFLMFSVGTLVMAFLATAVYFGLMAVYGTTTHKDLTGWGPRLMMALVAMIVTSLVGALFGFGFGASVLYCGIGGNAIRCVGKYLYDNGIVPRADLTIEAGGRVHRLHLYTRFGTVGLVTVEMGKPAFAPEAVPVALEGERVIDRPVTIAGGEYRITCLSMGNPHCVVFVDRVDEVDVAHLGPQFEHADLFPARTNTEFIRVVNRTTIKMRVWERGNGETRACGTGACAAVVAAVENGLCPKGETITVKVTGGDLLVTYDDDGVRLTGNAELAFTGVTTY